MACWIVCDPVGLMSAPRATVCAGAGVAALVSDRGPAAYEGARDTTSAATAIRATTATEIRAIAGRPRTAIPLRNDPDWADIIDAPPVRATSAVRIGRSSMRHQPERPRPP